MRGGRYYGGSCAAGRWRNWLPSSKIPEMCDCRLWHARRLALWLSGSVPLRPGSSSWKRRFWHGTDPARRAVALQRSPALVSSPRRHLSRRSEMARSSAQADSSRPGSGSCPATLEWRQGQAGADIEARGWLHQALAGAWRANGAALAPREARHASRLDRPAPGTAADKRRAGRHGQ